ncbi:MAG: hypothetical protein Kow00124_07810 [Anaerolineae bacterium]
MTDQPEEKKPEDSFGGEQGPEEEPLEGTSLEGKGWDILVGGRVNAAALGGENPFDESGHSADDEEADATLRAAASGAATSGADSDADKVVVEMLALTDEAWTPEREAALESLGAEPGPPLGEGAEPHDLPVPPAEEAGPAAAPAAGPAEGEEAVSPAPPWLAEAPPTTEAVPPGTVTSQAKRVRVSIKDPFAQPPAPPPAARDDLPVDPELVELLITPERIQALAQQIDRVYEQVVSEVQGDHHTTGDSLAKLQQARMLLMAGEEYYDNAEQLLMQVRARLELDTKVRRWTRGRGSVIALYLLLFLVLLVYGFISSNRVMDLARDAVPAWMAAMYLPALFGSLGGVVGGLWVLIKHTALRRDFDPIHTTWYLTNPFMGLLLGVIAYIIVWAGGSVLTLATSGETAPLELSTTSPVIYPICVIVGFNQNLLWRLIDSFIKAVAPSGEDEEVDTGSNTPTGTSGGSGAG